MEAVACYITKRPQKSNPNSHENKNHLRTATPALRAQPGIGVSDPTCRRSGKLTVKSLSGYLANFRTSTFHHIETFLFMKPKPTLWKLCQTQKLSQASNTVQIPIAPRLATAITPTIRLKFHHGRLTSEHQSCRGSGAGPEVRDSLFGEP
jgi:hypothetical protein